MKTKKKTKKENQKPIKKQKEIIEGSQNQPGTFAKPILSQAFPSALVHNGLGSHNVYVSL